MKYVKCYPKNEGIVAFLSAMKFLLELYDYRAVLYRSAHHIYILKGGAIV